MEQGGVVHPIPYFDIHRIIDLRTHIMKTTIASLETLVTAQSGLIKHLETRLEKLEHRAKAQAIAWRKATNTSGIDNIKIPENLSPEAQARVAASMQRRLELRAKAA